MPGLTQAVDLGAQYLSYEREEWAGRPVAAVTYSPGMVLQRVSQDLQVYPDANTVNLPSAGTLRTKLVGVVADTWPGFSGSLGTNTQYTSNATLPAYASPANQAVIRGTLGIDYVKKGFHPALLIDQSGTGAVTLTDGLGIVAAGVNGAPGYGQGIGIAAATPLTVYALASLPASGIGSSITAAALAQASQTDTLSGTPAAGDVLSVTIQSPYTAATLNTAQTMTWTAPPLTAGQAATVTTAALALLTYLNSQTTFSQYFTATQAAGVMTVTVNALGTFFRVYTAAGVQGNPSFFDIALTGMISNSLTFAVATVTGATVSTAGAANLAGGTGYKGPIPAFVTSII